MSEIYLSIEETIAVNNLPPGGALTSDKYSSTSYINPVDEIEETPGGFSGDYATGVVSSYLKGSFYLNNKWYYYQKGFPLQLCQWENVPLSGYSASYDLEVQISDQLYSTNDCISCAISTAMSIFTYLATGVKERFSIVWLHGNQWVDSSYGSKTSGSSGVTGNDDGAYVPEILDHLVSDGAVPFSCVYPHLCDRSHLHFSDEAMAGIGTARDFVTNHYSELLLYAQRYRLSSWQAISSTSISTIENAITTHGCVLLNMYMSDDLQNDVNGVISDVYPKSTGLTHIVCVVGWKAIGDEWYWICLNSWGDYYGDNGTWYIPINYSKIIKLYQMVPSINTQTIWDRTKNAGDAFYINAREWSRVEERLAKKLKNRGVTYTPTRKFRGKDITALDYNKMINAINSQLGTSYPTTTVGQSVTATLMSNLINGVNAL